MDIAGLIQGINKHKNLALNIGIIILSLTIANVIYGNQRGIMASLKENIDKETRKNKILSSIGNSDKTINYYKESINKKDLSSVITHISDIAGEAGVQIVSLRPKEEKKELLYKRYPFELAVKSKGYHAIGKFISRLESDPDIYLVENMEIRSAGREARAGELALTMVVSTIILQ